jgi:CheY-like chemotaxis protein
MRTLIVDHDLFSRKKLAESLSPYGDCESVATGETAIQRFQQAVAENNPYTLVTLDIDLSDIEGYELLHRLRSIGLAYGHPSPLFLMVGRQSGQEDILRAVANHCAGYLVKPLNKEKIVQALQRLDLQKESSPSSPTSVSTVAEPAVAGKPGESAFSQPKKEETLHDLLLQYIHDSTPETIKGLNRWLHSPTPEMEKEIHTFLLSGELEEYDKVQLLRWLQGYPKLNLLPTLGQLAVGITNTKLKKDLLLLLSKYDSIDALQELTRLNDILNNSMLKDVITSEVNRLRQQHPSLALIERFLASAQDRYALKNVLILLQKHLRPDQVVIFRRYLGHEQETLQNATFELLCNMDDQNGNGSLFLFLNRRLDVILGGRKTSGDEAIILELIPFYHHYLERFPQMACDTGEELSRRFPKILDLRLQQALLSIFLLAPDNRYLAFVLEQYRQKPELQEYLLPHLAAVPAAADFLLAEYHQGGPLKEKLMAALMANEGGAKYFHDHMSEQNAENTALILKNITLEHYPLFRDVVMENLHSSEIESRASALTIVKKFVDRSTEQALFDPEQMATHFQAGREYLECILHLFPFQTLHCFLQNELFQANMAQSEWQPTEVLTALAAMEPIVQLPSKERFLRFLEQQLNFGKLGRMNLLVKWMQNFKAFHHVDIRSILDGLNFYKEQKGGLLSPQDLAEVNTARETILTLQEEVRQLETVYKDIENCLKPDPPNLDTLDDLLRSQPMAFCLRGAAVIKRLRQYRTSADDTGKRALSAYLAKRSALAALFSASDSTASKPAESAPRWNIMLEDKSLQFFLADQFQELCPYIQVVCDLQVKNADIWIADTVSYNKVGVDKLLDHPRKYLIFQNPTEYADIKRIKPVAFSTPVNIFRMAKAILPTIPL